MGTRADFYVGRGPNAEWLGSISYDGYPSGNPESLGEAKSLEDFRNLVEEILVECDHATRPDQGWPWPWEDSRTTDYAYAYDEDTLFVSCFGYGWKTWNQVTALDDEEDPWTDEKGEDDMFPNMKDRQKVAFDKRSGALFIGLK